MAAVLVMAAPASAAQWIVDDNGLDCLDANQVSIQAAVTAAAPGDNIKVCAGVYNEEVDITKPGLKVYSTPKRAAIIKAPPTILASSDKAIVNIAADAVSLERFTITGPGPGPCDTLRYGVFVTGGNGVLVKDNHITRIQDTPFSGCQNGIGLRVGSEFLGFAADADVADNLIDNYQKGGIVIDGPGTNVLVQQNRTDGIGPTPITAQNGIQISRGATSEVLENIVEDNTTRWRRCSARRASCCSSSTAECTSSRTTPSATTTTWASTRRRAPRSSRTTSSGARSSTGSTCSRTRPAT